MISSEITFFSVEELLSAERERVRSVASNDEKVMALAESIRNQDIIHPVLVDAETGVLIAGLHRTLAFKHLHAQSAACRIEYKNWTLIPGRAASNVSESEILELELVENIKRYDLTWQQRADGIARYHEMRVKADPSWNLSRTAEALGVSNTKVSDNILIAKEMMKGNEKLRNVQTFNAASGIVSRGIERAIAGEVDLIGEIQDEILGKDTVQSEQHNLMVADFTVWVHSYSGPKFNFIHCDFPYGIDHDKSEQGKVVTWRGYTDTKETYFLLLDSLMKNLHRLAASECHIMLWFSMNFYTESYTILNAHGLHVDRYPMIWYKSDNKGILPDPNRGPRRNYETALLASIGDRKITQAVSNVYAAPVSKELHVSEKPESVLRHFFRMFVDENTNMLDPTCGSATSIRAAEHLGAKTRGMDIDAEMISHAQEVLTRARNIRLLSGK